MIEEKIEEPGVNLPKVAKIGTLASELPVSVLLILKLGMCHAKLVMVGLCCNCSTWESEAGGINSSSLDYTTRFRAAWDT